MRIWARAGAAALAFLAAGLVSFSAPSAYDPPSHPAGTLAKQIAAPWPALQRDSGEFRDHTDGRIPDALGKGTRYGDSLLGLALLQQGLREGDDRTIDAGLRGLAFAVSRGRAKYQRYKPSVFETMAVATAYNIARQRTPDNPIFRAARGDWEAWLLRVRPHETILRNPGTTRFANHYLIEALAVFELDKTGLSSSDPGSLLGGQRERALRIYTRLVNEGIPRRARREGVRSGGLPTFLISDPPDYPLAYQGLALGLYAQAVRELGPRASGAAVTTLRRAVNASWLLAAPDGDVGYFGRSHGQAWAQSGTALGAQVAASRAAGRVGDEARYRALADRSLARLREAYGSGPHGLHVIPALALDERLGARALDLYAGVPSFTGLTLVLLNWTLEETSGPPGDAPVAADRPGHARLARGASTFVAVRRGPVWFAVRRGRSRTRHPDDLRYDYGLIALKRRTAGRAWRDVTPAPPITRGPADSAGPILLRGGRRGLPEGDRIRVSPRGRVSVRGSFRASNGHAIARARVRVTPIACGVRTSFEARKGDRVEYSVFLRSLNGPPSVTHWRLGDERQVVTATPRPARVTVDRRRYHSATDPQLVRARMVFDVRRDRVIAIRTCGR